MAATPSLKGLRVVVTRPADAAEPICRMLENHGASVVRLPMQAIEPTRQPAAAAKSLQQARDAHAWIFTSANAVLFARSLDAGVWPRCVAVGPATAAALERSGIGTVLLPAERHDSEGVLALPELQDVLGKRILVVTGEGGRDAIESGLAARGAQVERVEVYRRVALPHAPETLAQAVAGADAAIVTNGEALQLLAERMPAEGRPALRGLQLVVPSRRVVEQAREIGFTTEPLIPEQPVDAGYLRSLEQWWRTARRDARMMRDNEVRPPPAADAPAADAPAAGAPAADAPAQGAPDAARPLPDAAPPAPQARFPWIGLLAGVLILALLAAAGWEGYRRAQAWLDAQDRRVRALVESLNAAEAQIDRLETRVSDQALATQRNAAEQARFAERLDAQDEAIGRLREQLGAGHGRVQLALVEQLLMLANERVQVGRDVDAAILALEAADARLAELRDPRLFAVREAVARERAALQAVAQPDSVGIALSLSGLIARAPQLGLANQAPQHFEAQPPAPAALPEDASPWVRAWVAVRRALASAFSVRRDDGPPPRLLGDEQTALIRQVLMLRLEGARVALLRRDAASFRDLCAGAADWLDQYYQRGDPAVAAARRELQRLAGLQLQPPLPDISGSLSLLRAQLEPAPQ